MSSKLSQLAPTPSPDPDDLMYIVRPVEGANGSKQITNDNLFSTITRNIADKTVRFDPPATTPPLSAAGQAALYYAQAQNRLMFSENGEAYKRVGNVIAPLAAGGNAIARFDPNNLFQLRDSPITIDDTATVQGPSLMDIRGGNTRMQFDAFGRGVLVEGPNPEMFRINSFAQTGGANTLFVSTSYAQTGAASSASVLIDRNETSLGAGVHDYVRGTKGGNEFFRINNIGHFISGRPTTSTGRFTAASAQSSNTQSFEAADTPQSTLVYKWPASDPLPGQVLIASPPVAGVVTLNWGFPAGMGRALPPRFDVVTNIAPGGGMHLVQIPPLSIVTIGSYIKFDMAGQLVVNNNRKGIQINLQFASNVYLPAEIGMDSTAAFPSNSWRIFGGIIRTASDQIRTITTQMLGTSAISFAPAGLSGGHIISTQDKTFTVPANQIDAQFFIIAVGTPVQSGDISQDLTTVEIYQF